MLTPSLWENAKFAKLAKFAIFANLATSWQKDTALFLEQVSLCEDIAVKSPNAVLGWG